MYVWFQGKVKSIYENMKNLLDPTPRFDSHISKNASKVTSLTSRRAHELTQVNTLSQTHTHTRSASFKTPVNTQKRTSCWTWLGVLCFVFKKLLMALNAVVLFVSFSNTSTSIHSMSCGSDLARSVRSLSSPFSLKEKIVPSPANLWPRSGEENKRTLSLLCCV